MDSEQTTITKEQIKAMQEAALRAAVDKIQAILDEHDVTLDATVSITEDGRIVATPIIKHK